MAPSTSVSFVWLGRDLQAAWVTRRIRGPQDALETAGQHQITASEASIVAVTTGMGRGQVDEMGEG